MSRRARSTPFLVFRLRTMLFLLTFIHKDSYASVVAPGCIHMRRNSSPLGGSTLIMSAPRCPSNITQKGPASAWVKSITRMSCRAPGMFRYLPEKTANSCRLDRPKLRQGHLRCDVFENEPYGHSDAHFLPRTLDYVANHPYLIIGAVESDMSHNVRHVVLKSRNRNVVYDHEGIDSPGFFQLHPVKFP